MLIAIFCYLTILSPLSECQLTETPVIQEIQRVKLNQFRVRWTVQNAQKYNLILNRIHLFYGVQQVEWPCMNT